MGILTQHLKDKDDRHGPFTCTSKVGTGTSFRFEILLIVTSCKLNGPKMCEKSCLRGGRSGKWGNLSFEKVYPMFVTITHLFRSLDVGHWHRQVQCTLHTNISCYVQVLRAVFQSYQLTHKLIKRSLKMKGKKCKIVIYFAVVAQLQRLTS